MMGSFHIMFLLLLIFHYDEVIVTYYGHTVDENG